MVITTLQKSAVDSNNRPCASFALPTGKGDSMPFTNPYVKKAIGETISYRFQFIALAHGCCHASYVATFGHLSLNSITSMIGVIQTGRWTATFLLKNSLSFDTLKNGRCMKSTRIFLGRLEAMPFLGHHMQEHWFMNIFDHIQVLTH